MSKNQFGPKRMDTGVNEIAGWKDLPYNRNYERHRLLKLPEFFYPKARRLLCLIATRKKLRTRLQL